jgi:hypothetical protein
VNLHRLARVNALLCQPEASDRLHRKIGSRLVGTLAWAPDTQSTRVHIQKRAGQPAWHCTHKCSQRRRQARALNRIFAGLRSPWQHRWPCMCAMPAATPCSVLMRARQRHARAPRAKTPASTACRRLPPLQYSCTPLAGLHVGSAVHCRQRGARDHPETVEACVEVSARAWLSMPWPAMLASSCLDSAQRLEQRRCQSAPG